MKNNASGAVRLAAWFIFWVVGTAVGTGVAYRVNALLRAAFPSAQVATPASPVNSYSTIVLAGIDSFTAEKPQVEAVWLALIPSDQSAVQLIGLQPDPFRDQYSRQDGLSLLLLQPYVMGSVIGTVTLDRGSVIELTDRLGGVWLAGQQLSGAELLNFLDAADPAEPNDRLLRQGAAVQGILAKIATSGIRLNLPGLFEVPNRTTLDEAQALAVISRYYPLTTDKVQVRLLIGDVKASSTSGG